MTAREVKGAASGPGKPMGAADLDPTSRPPEFLLELLLQFQRDENGILSSGLSGYWSNLDKEENEQLIDALKTMGARAALMKHQPWLENIIYSPKRQAGLELLELNGNETCIDYGCMWGASTIPLAKRTKHVLGVDQTLDSLRFLKARTTEENVANVDLLNHDILRMPVLSNKVDVAIVNGVLEWIPEQGAIALQSYYGRSQQKEYSANPYDQQRKFLVQVLNNLSDGGKLYLAIENRYDFKMFLGAKDPHANLLFTSFLPRKLANLISKIQLKRPYVNWLYSFNEIRKLLTKVGFSKVDLYMCFPDYRYPERIIPYDGSLESFEPTILNSNIQGEASLKRLLARTVERFIFRRLRLRFVAPSIIAVAQK